jgi:hypothetical protein
MQCWVALRQGPYSLYFKIPTETPPAYFCAPKVRWKIWAAFPAPEQGWGGMIDPHAGVSNDKGSPRRVPTKPPKVNRLKTATREQLRQSVVDHKTPSEDTPGEGGQG